MWSRKADYHCWKVILGQWEGARRRGLQVIYPDCHWLKATRISFARVMQVSFGPVGSLLARLTIQWSSLRVWPGSLGNGGRVNGQMEGWRCSKRSSSKIYERQIWCATDTAKISQIKPQGNVYIRIIQLDHFFYCSIQFKIIGYKSTKGCAIKWELETIQEDANSAMRAGEGTWCRSNCELFR